MARKSIKNIRDIFESNSTTKSPTFIGYCDMEQTCNINDNQLQVSDKLTNKSKIPNKIKDPQQDKPCKTKNTTNMIRKHDFKFGTVRDRVGKLNQEAMALNASPNTPTRIQKSGTMNNRQLNQNDSIADNEKLNRSQTLPTNQKNIRIRKLNLNNFEKIPVNQRSNTPSPRTPKSSKIFNNYPSKIALPKKDYRKNNEVVGNVVPAKSTPSKKEQRTSKKQPQKQSALPGIPPKPKYINQIKPHPNLPPKSKKALQEKIHVFNNLGNKNEEGNHQEEDQNRKSRDYENWKNVSVSKGVQNSNSEEDIYDLVVTTNLKNQQGTNLKPQLPSKPSLGQEKDAYGIVDAKDNKVATRSSPKALVGSYLNNKRCMNSIPEDIQQLEKNHKNTSNSKFANNKKNLRVMSKDHSLEDEGYVVITNENSSSADNDSSEEELATEYDVIENLNVTKITVERRYKVPNNEEDESTFNVKRETYYDHNLNPRIERISRQVQKGDASHNICRKQCATKSSMIIQELLQTELAYFKGLLKVYEDYIVYFKESPPPCSPNISKVFGNFEDIYKMQIEFYGQLTECNGDVNVIADTFFKNEPLFDLYKKYILNKHTSNKHSTGDCLEAIKTREMELGNALNLESYLLTPFQRLIRYRLLLKNLHDTLEKENVSNSKLKAVIDYLDDLIEGTNLQVKLMQGIQDAPIDLMNSGKLLMVDDCFLRHNGKKYCSTVILFESVIIFTKKTESDKYIYKGSINLSDLYVRSITEEETSFQLQDFTQYKLKHDNKYVYDVEVKNPKIKQEWVKKIEMLLWNQFAAHKRS
ncbi:Pleckstrin homology domain containing protein [Oryctes borbonicus]|uniref:Pleckstrin homology domain containing protein n=1 Tax=Oryctes borbonicus TaxID=1629725 RepID=A0A0T6ATW4_9SCAR|nr:Pleckstrin homology domain containing protein [Oryctes borbonicus]